MIRVRPQLLPPRQRRAAVSAELARVDEDLKAVSVAFLASEVDWRDIVVLGAELIYDRRVMLHQQPGDLSISVADSMAQSAR